MREPKDKRVPSKDEDRPKLCILLRLHIIIICQICVGTLFPCARNSSTKLAVVVSIFDGFGVGNSSVLISNKPASFLFLICTTDAHQQQAEYYEQYWCH
jgi:hypothetical protein